MKPKLIGSSTGSTRYGAPLGVERIHGAVERGEVAVLLGDQHRDRGDLVGDREASSSLRLSRKSAPALPPRNSSSASAESTLTLKPFSFSARDRLLEMRKRRVGKAAEIDHVGAASAHRSSARFEDRLDAERGRIDDLGEDPDVVSGHVGGFPRPAEKKRDVLELVGSAQEGHAEALARGGRDRRGSGRAA